MKTKVILVFLLISITLASIAGIQKAIQTHDVIAQKREITQFTNLEVSAPVDIRFEQSETPSLEIKGSSEILSEIETSVENNTLKISAKKKTFRNREFKNVYIILKNPAIKKIELFGAANFWADKQVKADMISLFVNGSGDIRFADLFSEQIGGNITGSGSIYLKSKTSSAELAVKITGSGDFNSTELKAETVDVKIIGSGDCMVQAVKEMNTHIIGSGDIYYVGKPQINSRIIGSGEVKAYEKNKIENE